MSTFTRYMLDFYGANSEVYPSYAFTIAEIVLATQLYQMRCASRGVDFEGDSIDRERVRDIIIDAREQSANIVI